METTHWADWADTFKLQDATCLIAGVSPANEMVAWADKLPPEARPAFKKLWDSYLRATGIYKRPTPDSVDFPKMLHGIPAEDLRAPTVASARGFIPRQEMLVAPSAELMRERLENVRVSREELCRWVKAMGMKSAYSFQPQHANTQPQAVSVKAGAENSKPVQRSAAQDAAILAALRKAGRDPLALPVNEPGKPGVKAEIRAELEGINSLFPKGGTVFNKTWERLRSRGDIADKA